MRKEMKNRNPWTEPFVPGVAFLVALIVIAIPTLYLTTPWNWNLPWISRVAGIAFFPFAATVVIYCPVAFLKRIFNDRRNGMKVLGIFVSCVLGILFLLLPVWLISGFEPIDSWIVGGVSVWAIWYFNYRFDRTTRQPVGGINSESLRSSP